MTGADRHQGMMDGPSPTGSFVSQEVDKDHMDNQPTRVNALTGLAGTTRSDGHVDVLRSVLDDFPALFALTDASGRVEFVNRRVAEYFDRTFEELKDWVHAGVIHPDDLPDVVEAWARSLDGGRPFDMECRFRRGDGSYRWFHARTSPTRDAEGRIVFWHVVASDIDDRTRREAALRKSEAYLTEAQKVSLGALTVSIAHEVNQPLSGILTNASTCLRMLASEPPNVAGARETARRMIRDGKRASEVITRLRALFARKAPTLEPVDLNEATREVIALSRKELQRSRAIVHAELAEDLPVIMGDRIQLQQVIMNLLRNASDAMSAVGDRPREIVITTSRDDDGDRVRLSVKDSGPGFGSQNMDKVFEAFYTTKHDGMGIGLAVSRSIVESHRGRLWVAPNDGPGVTFSFAIPRGLDFGVDAYNPGAVSTPTMARDANAQRHA